MTANNAGLTHHIEACLLIKTISSLPIEEKSRSAHLLMENNGAFTQRQKTCGTHPPRKTIVEQTQSLTRYHFNPSSNLAFATEKPPQLIKTIYSLPIDEESSNARLLMENNGAVTQKQKTFGAHPSRKTIVKQTYPLTRYHFNPPSNLPFVTDKQPQLQLHIPKILNVVGLVSMLSKPTHV